MRSKGTDGHREQGLGVGGRKIKLKRLKRTWTMTVSWPAAACSYSIIQWSAPSSGFSLVLGPWVVHTPETLKFVTITLPCIHNHFIAFRTSYNKVNYSRDPLIYGSLISLLLFGTAT